MNPLLIGIGIGFITYGLGIKLTGAKGKKDLPDDENASIKDSSDAKIVPTPGKAESDDDDKINSDSGVGGASDIVDLDATETENED